MAGRKKKNKNLGSLKYQVVQKLNSLTRYGESKHAAKHEEKKKARAEGRNWNPARVEGVFSGVTRSGYQQNALHFIKWEQTNHPEQKVLQHIPRSHMEQYLQQRIDRGLSAWTLNRDASALAKISDRHVTDFQVDLPKRRVEDIKKNRGPLDYKWITKNPDISAVALGAGPRKQAELQALRPDNVYEKDGQIWVYIERGKGGRSSTHRVLDEYKEIILDLRDKAISEGRNRLIDRKIPKDAIIHTMRRSYAQHMYAQIEAELARKDPYIIAVYNQKHHEWYEKNSHAKHRGLSDTMCLRDGREFERTICFIISEYLGHGREDVVVTNYLR